MQFATPPLEICRDIFCPCIFHFDYTRKGQGVCSSSHYPRRETAGDHEQCELPDPPIEAGLLLVRKRQQPTSKAVSRFLEFLQAEEDRR